jgi:hypothetical protein
MLPTNLRKCKTCGVEKSLEEFYRKPNGKFGRTAHCKTCSKPAVAHQNAKRYTESREEVLAANRAWRGRNAESCNQYARDWRKNNPSQRSVQQAKRRASKLQAVPAWTKGDEFNDLFLLEVYSLARQRSELTNLLWHVDHKVPLKSNAVCGLHYFANLDVVPATVNVRKNNKVWEDMP